MKGNGKPVLGITALIPPELVYACGWSPLDLNNLVPGLDRAPTRRLCAWTASWRELVLKGEVGIDALAVVAGGDCHNALVDGQDAAEKTRPHYFFYPFDGDKSRMAEQLRLLEKFLGGEREPGAWARVSEIKLKLREIEDMLSRGDVDAEAAFQLLISGADLLSDLDAFESRIKSGLPPAKHAGYRVALLGVPPIHRDFHLTASACGLQVVFNELPHEFLRLGGSNIEELSGSYSDYTFARPLSFRLQFLKEELGKLKLDGVIHYTQYACHHMLEDRAIRECLDFPVLTVQGDSPGLSSAGTRLRLEAFSEMLGGIP